MSLLQLGGLNLQALYCTEVGKNSIGTVLEEHRFGLEAKDSVSSNGSFGGRVLAKFQQTKRQVERRGTLLGGQQT